jgi:hypothetical protein
MANKTTLSPAERHTGQDAKLKFKTSAGSSNTAKTYEIAVSNVDWSRSTGTTDVQHNDGLTAVKALTDIRFSGSFEYSGQNFDAINAFAHGNTNEGKVEVGKPARGTLTVKEEDPEDASTTYIYTFKNTVVTDTSRSNPSDDSSTTSMDWEAEGMLVKKSSGSGQSSDPNDPNNQG